VIIALEDIKTKGLFGPWLDTRKNLLATSADLKARTWKFLMFFMLTVI
jgi:hypothetical protein